MATHTQIQTAVDNYWTTNLRAKFIAVQEAYAASHGGRYFQGILTPTTPPDDGAVVNPDQTKKPTDQVERWLDVFTGANALPATNWPVSVSIDVYDGPDGKGWVVNVIYTKGGETWSRSFNTGPETWRERPWERVS